ncbi:hypothetical protein E2C01_001752 [Portunus trituberculatus]|uniref:Uncharacterized protein n=1 Tax=Portunus trituberculatus TaxID=210409 RepID=A0A5B7CI44_PORTR|nr:hypothetical protein [Portunus trituberculatus]
MTCEGKSGSTSSLWCSSGSGVGASTQWCFCCSWWCCKCSELVDGSSKMSPLVIFSEAKISSVASLESSSKSPSRMICPCSSTFVWRVTLVGLALDRPFLLLALLLPRGALFNVFLETLEIIESAAEVLGLERGAGCLGLGSSVVTISGVWCWCWGIAIWGACMVGATSRLLKVLYSYQVVWPVCPTCTKWSIYTVFMFMELGGSAMLVVPPPPPLTDSSIEALPSNGSLACE